MNASVAVSEYVPRIRFDTAERWGVLYTRIAVGAAFLSAVASRFGVWDLSFNVAGHFAKFIQFTGEVNSFMPAWTIPYLAVAATIAESTFGILLVLGLWQRWVSIGAAVLLFLFGTAMAISYGPQSPMDYSVFSASGAAVMLALNAFAKHESKGTL